MEHLEGDRRRSAPKLTFNSLISIPTVRLLTNIRLVPVFISVALILAWEFGSGLKLIPSLFFPAPSLVLQTAGKLINNGVLVTHFLATLERMTWGILIGGSLGLILGLGMGWSQRLRTMIDPLIAALHPLPKIAILPLFMVYFGVGNRALIVVVAFSVMFPMLISTMAGTLQIHPIHFDVAKNLGARPIKIFRRVIIPGSLPSILTGLRLALNTTLLITVAVEMVSARQGLGSMIWIAWTTLRTEEIFVSLLTITLMGYLINVGISALSALLIPWKLERSV
jgi:ABC-type nitrate/sulfonate/bicarbonate transport system permease component